MSLQFHWLVVLLSIVASLNLRAQQSDIKDLEDILEGWEALSATSRTLPAVEIVEQYLPRYFDASKVFYSLNQDAGVPLDPISPIHSVIYTDGNRYSCRMIPDKEGRVKLPPGSLESPFAIFDGERFAFSLGNSLILTKKRPYLGYPLPEDMVNLIPISVAPRQCSNWSDFCEGRILDWLKEAKAKGEVKITSAVPGKKTISGFIKYPNGKRNDSGEFVEIELDQSLPLWPQKVTAGTIFCGKRDSFTVLTFSNWHSYSGRYLPKEIVATLKFNLSASVYAANPDRLEQYHKLIAGGMPRNGDCDLFEHRVILESVKVLETLEEQLLIPISPGTKVIDKIRHEDYIFGEGLRKIEGKATNKP